MTDQTIIKPAQTIHCARYLFDIPSDIHYFNCAYMTPLLKTAYRAGVDGLGQKLSPWKIQQEDFFAPSEEARRLFARLVGATADDIAIIPSASYGIGIAAHNINLKSGDEILVLEGQFPSNIYPWRDAAARTGARIITVNTPSDSNWTAALVSAITPRTKVIAIPHCHWVDGNLIDLVTVRTLCDKSAAALVVDGTQSVGACPFDVQTIRPDFLICAAYKWLLGPYSLGFMYADQRWHDGRPLEHNWITRQDAENMSRLMDYTDARQPGARRFDMGERSNFALLPVVIAALNQLLEWGVPNIAKTLGDINDSIFGQLEWAGKPAMRPPYQAPHYLTIPLPDSNPDAILANFAENQVYASVRGNSLRLTAHLYVSEEDIEALVNCLRLGK